MLKKKRKFKGENAYVAVLPIFMACSIFTDRICACVPDTFHTKKINTLETNDLKHEKSIYIFNGTLETNLISMMIVCTYFSSLDRKHLIMVYLSIHCTQSSIYFFVSVVFLLWLSIYSSSLLVNNLKSLPNAATTIQWWLVFLFYLKFFFYYSKHLILKSRKCYVAGAFTFLVAYNLYICLSVCMCMCV